jgi:hypothetical protein
MSDELVARLRAAMTGQTEELKFWKNACIDKALMWESIARIQADAATIARLEGEWDEARTVLLSIVQVYEARSELFTNDADCAGNLHDRAKAALRAALPAWKCERHGASGTAGTACAQCVLSKGRGR